MTDSNTEKLTPLEKGIEQLEEEQKIIYNRLIKKCDKCIHNFMCKFKESSKLKCPFYRTKSKYKICALCEQRKQIREWLRNKLRHIRGTLQEKEDFLKEFDTL